LTNCISEPNYYHGLQWIFHNDKEDIIILNVYPPNGKILEHIKHKLKKLAERENYEYSWRFQCVSPDD
jgi:hypothetical protein